MPCEITSTAHHFGGEKRDISLLTTLNRTLSTFADQNASFFPSKHHFVWNLFHFLLYNHSKGTFFSFCFLLNFSHKGSKNF